MKFIHSQLKNSNNHIQLVSIHIPKTAGTSFRLILEQVYNKKKVARLDIFPIDKQIKLNNKIYNSDILPSNYKIIHGHISLSQVHKRLGIDKNVPVITWLRHPVDRVFSSYYYLENRLIEELNENEKGSSITGLRLQLQRTFKEYITAPTSQNVMSRFIDIKNLPNLFFIGLQEHFSNDLEYLSKKLGWSGLKEFRKNKIDHQNKINIELKELILKMNQSDMELYNRALEVRRKRD